MADEKTTERNRFLINFDEQLNHQYTFVLPLIIRKSLLFLLNFSNNVSFEQAPGAAAGNV
jgi:hypothetical protein